MHDDIVSAITPSIAQVADKGICVGCGACEVATQGRIAVRRNALGIEQVDLGGASPDDLARASATCPFSDEASTEDALSQNWLPPLPEHDPRLGRFLSSHAGRVLEGENVELSSSGGLTSWVALQILARGWADGVIHVSGSASPEDGLFSYRVSTSEDEVRARRKSQYYSTSFAAVVRHIRGDGKRYVFIGVPCFVKAVRLLQKQDPVLAGQVAFCLGLVCGHLKSSGFSELLAWQVGVHPRDLARVDFRVKTPTDKTAGDYSFSAWARGSSTPMTKPTRSLLGGNWGHAMFQLKACDFCDDVFAETADIAFGDAWLPEYSADWRGTNVVVNRNPRLEEILQQGLASGRLMLEPLSPDRAALSQDGNYRHRWDGLSLRLQDDIERGEWVPRKRVAPGSRPLTEQRVRIVRLRRRIAEESHGALQAAKQKDSLKEFRRRMNPLVAAMDKEYGNRSRYHPLSLLRAVARRVKRLILR